MSADPEVEDVDRADAQHLKDSNATVIAALAVAGLLAAIYAQLRLDAAVQDPQLGLLDVKLLYLVAAVTWIAALSMTRPDFAQPVAGVTIPEDGPGDRQRRARRLIVGFWLLAFTVVLWPAITGPAGGGLGILAYPGALGGGDHIAEFDGSNHLTLPGLGFWLIGAALVISSLAAPIDRRVLAAAMRRSLRVTPLGMAVIAVTVLALIYRIYDLAAVPQEMTSDHTEKLLDVRRVLDGMRPIFFWNNAGREPLQFYLSAALVGLGLPLSFGTLKLGMALVSTATVPIVFGVARRLAGAEAGLFAALIAAVAPWHIQITRIGLRSAFSPFFVAATLWLVLRALDSGRRNDWIFAGLVAAAGLYGYTGYRPMALVIAMLVALHLARGLVRARGGLGWRAYLRSQRPLAGHFMAAATCGIAVLAPLLRYAVDRPKHFLLANRDAHGRCRTPRRAWSCRTPRPAFRPPHCPNSSRTSPNS
jgi:hypothetical protein